MLAGLGRCLHNLRSPDQIQLFKSPSDAWQAAFQAYGLDNGEVLTSPFASARLLQEIKKAGLQIRLADIERKTLVPSAEDIISRITPQIRAIILPLGLGLPDDLQNLKDLAASHGLPLIIDCESGLLARYGGEALASQGHAAICSLAGNVWLPGLTGAVFLRNSAVQPEAGPKALPTGEAMTWLQAARCVWSLPRWAVAQDARRKALELYLACLAARALAWQPDFIAGRHEPDFGFYPVLLESEQKRDILLRRLAENNIRAQSFPLAARLLPDMEECPMARDIVKRVACLPLGADAPGDTIQEIADTLADISRSQTLFPKKRYAEPPQVSVLTVTYNHEAYIEDCLKSVAMQQCDFPIEHIVGDDASNDRTREIILDYAAKYPHIRPLFQDKRSYATGNTKAVYLAAAAPYVALCEGDDFFTDPLKLQKQADALDANPGSSICAHPVKVLQEGVGETGLYPERAGATAFLQKRHIFSLDELLRHNLIQTNSVMYRWRFGNGLPPWYNSQVMPHDWYMHLLHAETGSIFFIWEPMSVYRRHAQGVWQDALARPKVHFKNFGYQQLRLLQIMMKHLQGRHASILLENSAILFGQLYEFFGDEPEKIAFFRQAFPRFALFYDREQRKKPWRRKVDWFVRSALRKIRNMAAADI